MEASTVRDQRALLEVLREIYAQRDLAAFPATLLVALGRMIPSAYAAYQEIDLRDAAVGLTVQWPAELVAPPDYTRYQEHVRRDHPLPAYYTRFPRSGACRLSDFLPRRRYHRTALYAEFYKRLGVEHQLSIPIAMRSPFFRGVILNRGTRDFSERERRLLDLVRPHVEVALRNAEAFAALRRRLHAAERALDARELGLIVVDGAGRVRMRSERARMLERTYFGRPKPATRLAATLADWASACLSRLTRSDGAEPPTPLVVQHADARLVVRLLPDPAAGEHVVLMEAQSLAPSRGTLDALGLSPRETDVLQWVALGKTNAEIAGILGLSPRTVQKHLEHVFEQLGVETRTAAAARAWEPTTASVGTRVSGANGDGSAQ